MYFSVLLENKENGERFEGLVRIKKFQETLNTCSVYYDFIKVGKTHCKILQ